MASVLTQDQINKLAKLAQVETLAARTKVITDNLQTQIDALDDEVVKSVTLAKDAIAAEGYAASYTITVNDTALETKINIPKDFLVKSAELKTVETANTPYAGAAEGDKYIDFVVNTKADGDGKTETDNHIYLAVNDLVDVYTSGNGVNVGDDNKISLVIDGASVGGLTVGANGLKLAVVTADTYEDGTKTADGVAGAMSSADKYKLDNVSSEANKTTVTNEKAGTIEIDGVTKTIVEFATDEEFNTMLDLVLPAPSSTEPATTV